MTPRHPARTALGTVLLTAIALTLPACNRDAENADETTTTTLAPAPAPPTTPAISPESRRLLDDPDAVIPPQFTRMLSPAQLEVARAYVRAEQAWIKAGMEPINPDHPDLAATTGDQILENVKELTRQRAAGGSAYQAPNVLIVSPTKVAIDGTFATFDSCLSEHIALYDVATGSITEEQFFSVDQEADLELRNGRWLVVNSGRVSEYRTGNTCTP